MMLTEKHTHANMNTHSALGHNNSSDHLHGCGVFVVKMEYSFKPKGLCEHV